MSGLLGDLAAWITDVVYNLGYAGVALLIALENLFPPIPSELVLPLAGFLVGTGRFWFPAVLLAATAGSVGSALVLYGLGYVLGEERTRRYLDRYGRYVFLRPSDVDRTDRWFERHGGKAVLIGRLVPGVRSLISLPAGLVRMPLLPFVVFTTIGSGLWNTLLVSIGWALGSRWEAVAEYTKLLEYVTLAVLALLVLRFVLGRWRMRRQRATGRDPQAGTPGPPL